MKELQLIKSANFGEIQCDIYSCDNEVYMTSEQLGESLEYSQPIKSISNLVERSDYLKSKEFSVVTKLMSRDGKRYDTRIFTEDGIYEVTMLSKTEKAKEFRAWIRKLLKSLRTGKTKIVDMTEYQKIITQTRTENIRIRKAQILERLSNQYDGTYKQVLQAHATKELTGDFLLPLPTLEAKTYSATEIGDRLGISAHRVGALAKTHNIKTKEYGAWFNDKAKGHSKEVQSFRYYESAIPVFEQLVERSRNS